MYNLNVINQIKYQLKNDSQAVQESVITDRDEKIDHLKYKSLYRDILFYFQEKQPYCDPDFTISQLAAAIDSNVNYISKAIKLNNNVNFNVFVNTYRINKIKDMLDNDYQNKFTIRYIYTSAGFRHQSTFNKVFKQIAGITPSEYIANRQSEEKSENDNKETDDV